MKKKILIVIVAVAMMIPLLAVGVSAEQSVIWPESSGEVDAIDVNLRTFNFDGTNAVVSLPISTLGYTLYRIYISQDMLPDNSVQNYFGKGNATSPYSIENTAFIRVFDGEQYLTDDDNHDAVLANNNNANNVALYFRSWYAPDSAKGGVTVNLDSNTGNFVCSFVGITYNLGEGAYIDYYVLNKMAPLAVDSTNTATVEWFEVVEGESPLVSLIRFMFDNFSRIIGGLAAGVMGAFTALIWENPEATEKTLSTAAKFIFTIAGLSIGMTVFYLVLRLIRFGRQR